MKKEERGSKGERANTRRYITQPATVLKNTADCSILGTSEDRPSGTITSWSLLLGVGGGITTK